jgi:hypothetical protein
MFTQREFNEEYIQTWFYMVYVFTVYGIYEYCTKH